MAGGRVELGLGQAWGNERPKKGNECPKNAPPAASPGRRAVGEVNNGRRRTWSPLLCRDRAMAAVMLHVGSCPSSLRSLAMGEGGDIAPCTPPARRADFMAQRGCFQCRRSCQRRETGQDKWERQLAMAAFAARRARWPIALTRLIAVACAVDPSRPWRLSRCCPSLRSGLFCALPWAFCFAQKSSAYMYTQS